MCCGCVASHGLALVSNEVQEHVEANLLPGATVRGYRARALLFPHENRGSRIGTLHVMLIEAAGVKNCDLCGTNAFATLRLGAQWQRSLTKSVVRGIKDVAAFKETRHRIAFGDQFVFDAFDGTPVLVLELWDEDYKVKVELGNKKAQLGADDYIGRCFVPLTTLVDHRAVDRWYKLEGKGNVGKVRLRLLFKPAGVMHCDGACTSEIALVGMVEADEYATGRKLERSPRSEFLGGGVDAKSIAAAEALRSVAHERAALDARNEFWAGWATQRGFRNAKWRCGARSNSPTSTGRLSPTSRATRPTTPRAPPPSSPPPRRSRRGGEGAVKSAIEDAMKAAEGLSTSLDEGATIAVDAALDAAQAGAVVAGSVVRPRPRPPSTPPSTPRRWGAAAVLDLTDAAVGGLSDIGRLGGRPPPQNAVRGAAGAPCPPRRQGCRVKVASLVSYKHASSRCSTTLFARATREQQQNRLIPRTCHAFNAKAKKSVVPAAFLQEVPMLSESLPRI